MRTCTLVVLMLVAGLGHAAGIFKWVDAQGRVHYGDQPPDEQARELQLPRERRADPQAQQRLEQQRRLLNAIDEERRVAREQQAKTEHEAATRRQRCTDARRRQAEYTDTGRLFRYEANGERHYLSEAERAGALTRLQEEVHRLCAD